MQKYLVILVLFLFACQESEQSTETILARIGDKTLALEIAAFVAGNVISWRETKGQAKELLIAVAGEISAEEAEMALELGKSADLETLVARLLAD